MFTHSLNVHTFKIQHIQHTQTQTHRHTDTHTHVRKHVNTTKETSKRKESSKHMQRKEVNTHTMSSTCCSTMFSGLRSRWMIRLLCRYSSADATSCVRLRISNSCIPQQFSTRFRACCQQTTTIVQRCYIPAYLCFSNSFPGSFFFFFFSFQELPDSKHAINERSSNPSISYCCNL